ncbi:MAG: delta-lactam-biosynthetic de-N-acetylase [Ruminococcaceae bacterium]|nr:delta-lactam-biosynthetic de-N-acetylase [Oscillospiraceae bacterium]
MKKLIFIGIFAILCVAVFLNSSISAAENESISWYCVRNKEHKQPVADSKLSIVEKYNGYYVDKAHADPNGEKVIYLTFDAGYENGNIEKILNVLKEEQVSAAFFILENLVIKNKELVIRMAEDGHTVANHTASHKDITKFESKEELMCELEEMNSVYREATGREMSKYFRPPEGRFSQRSMEYLSELGYKTVFWSLAYADWDNNNQPKAELAKKKIFDNIHNGAVILMHPTSATNAKIMRDVIRTLKSQGYRFGTLDELTRS